MVTYDGGPTYTICPENVSNVPLEGFWVIFMGQSALAADTGKSLGSQNS